MSGVAGGQGPRRPRRILTFATKRIRLFLGPDAPAGMFSRLKIVTHTVSPHRVYSSGCKQPIRPTIQTVLANIGPGSSKGARHYSLDTALTPPRSLCSLF